MRHVMPRPLRYRGRPNRRGRNAVKRAVRMAERYPVDVAAWRAARDGGR
jgi:hypothetical protein